MVLIRSCPPTQAGITAALHNGSHTIRDCRGGKRPRGRYETADVRLVGERV